MRVRHSSNSDSNGAPDRDLILALTPKRIDALAQRFDRVRAMLGDGNKKARFNAVLSITSDKVGEAQLVVRKVLDRVAKRWVIDEVVTHTGRPSEVYYFVRIRKSVTRDEVITAIRSWADDTIAAIDLGVGDALAREQEAKS